MSIEISWTCKSQKYHWAHINLEITDYLLLGVILSEGHLWKLSCKQQTLM